MPKCGIYSITNKETGQKYIGQSTDITRRFWQHKNQGQSASYIDRAIKKHGADNFEFEILEECKANKLNQLEMQYIKKYNTYKDENHYNLTSGGDTGYSTSKEIRNKIAKKQFERHNGKGAKRDINYLLKRYYAEDGITEKKRVGEIWSPYHDTMSMREKRTFERWNLLEGIITERKTRSGGTFKFPEGQKARARYLIKHLDFRMGRYSAEQMVVMIIIYVKLEADNSAQIKQYCPFLESYGLTLISFVSFLIKLNKFHYQKN